MSDTSAAIRATEHKPEISLGSVNLASPRLGANIIEVSDDFFGAAERMLNDAPPIFFPDRCGVQAAHMEDMGAMADPDIVAANEDWPESMPALTQRRARQTQHQRPLAHTSHSVGSRAIE